MDVGLMIEGLKSFEFMRETKLVTHDEYLELERKEVPNLMGPISLNAICHSTTYQAYPAAVAVREMLAIAPASDILSFPMFKMVTEAFRNWKTYVPNVVRVTTGAVLAIDNEAASDASPFQMFVKGLDGKVITLEVSGNTTGDQVKKMVEDKLGVPADQQRLTYCGRVQVESDCKLKDYGITKESTIHLMLRLRGGECATYFFDKAQHDPNYDYDFTNIQDRGWIWSDKFSRGGQSYERPCGWKRFALKVVDQYDNGNNTWLGESGIRANSSPGEWPVSYHGTNDKAAREIAKSGYDIKCGKRFLYGEGIYSTPSIDCAALYANEITYRSETYQLILQNRVHPERLDFIPAAANGVGDYFISPNESDVRPYGLCFKLKS